MKEILRLSLLLFLLNSCGNVKPSLQVQDNTSMSNTQFTIAFGSCNREELPQPLWEPILSNSPNVFIWGGDNVYTKDGDLEALEKHYQNQNSNKDYQNLKKNTEILATWDDHDYGLNDGGVEWERKKESQDLFLDFLEISPTSPRRKQEGVYHSRTFETEKGSVKIIILDTRYFRSPLIKSDEPGKRYEFSPRGTVLGKHQWEWLKDELNSSRATFNVIVSSIQVLSHEHGFETWGNFPHEVVKLQNLIVASKAKNVLLLSGDRHISEFSKTKVVGMEHPLIDFTSSGLTHTYTSFTGEPNRYREGKVINDLSFGLLFFDFDKNKVTMQMRGEGNLLQQEFTQVYK